VEQANITVVNEFCAAFVAPLDWAHITSFLSADCKYRATQTTPVAEGHQAIEDLLKGFVDSATSIEFEMVDTWARGPVVVNDRVDRFTLPDRELEIPVVGVFHLVDGVIVEWSDFVFDFPL
jgi:limonene-1,2-epoxide hydrolase